jgi:endonuclease G
MGRLVRSHLGVAGDCAVCSIVGRQLNDRILELDIVPKRIAKAALGDKVVKSGRTTGVTHGIVTRVGVVTNVNYGGTAGTQQIGGFEIGVNPEKPPGDGEVTMGGDSGSLWLIDTASTDKDVAVGLHFAGETDPNPTAEHALACAIHSVLQKLQVSFRNPLAEPESASRRTVRRSQRRR